LSAGGESAIIIMVATLFNTKRAKEMIEVLKKKL
jgi:hypothetical protein